jgi:hypothetical protein
MRPPLPASARLLKLTQPFVTIVADCALLKMTSGLQALISK